MPVTSRRTHTCRSVVLAALVAVLAALALTSAGTARGQTVLTEAPATIPNDALGAGCSFGNFIRLLDGGPAKTRKPGVNHAPHFAAARMSRSIDENSPAGANVGSPVTATDADGDALSYTLAGNDASSFAINGSSGQIHVGRGASLDHETKDSYSVTVTATDTSDATDTVKVNIAVNNINEAPQFGAASVSRVIDENSAPGTNLGSPVTAIDPDGDALSYILAGKDASSFAINGSSGQIHVGRGASLDHETKDSYTVTVIAADPQSLTATATVNIEIKNLNEAPEFGVSTLSRVIDENSAPGTNLGSPVTAIDPDGGTLSYTLAGKDASSFAINGSSGQIHVGRGASLDYEAESTYTVTVIAADPQSLTDTATVNIEIKNLNEAPEFGVSTLSRVIDENSAPGTNLGSPVTAIDPDGGTLSYILAGKDASSFAINGSSGQIHVGRGASLDHETKDSYSVTVTATDTSDATDTVTVNITVNNINEAPRFGAASVSRVIDENSAPGTNLGSPVTAIDPDGAALSYTLAGPADLELAPGTAQIRVAPNSGLDYETTPAYALVLTARDPGGLTATITVNVALNDVNDPPEFAPGALTRPIDENSAAGTSVGTPVTATDDDGGALSYTLGGPDANRFSIDGNSGQIRVGAGAVLDYEAKPTYTVTVIAADLEGLTGSIEVNIAVNDVNEPPEFGAASVSRAIDENSAPGTNLGSPVTATDPEGAALSYSSTGANPGGFTVTAAGQIRTGRELDHESNPSHAITLRAQDPGGLADTVQVTINVTNVNDPPRFPSPSAALTVHDRAAAGENVGTPVTAADQDGGALTYTLGGLDRVTFTIGSSSGQLAVAAGTTIGAAGSSYSVTVTATDQPGAAGTISVRVNVVRYVPPDLPGPPVREFGDSLCMGFPGCPDSYLFLFPTLAVLGVAGLSWRGRRRVPSVYVLLGVWLFSMIGASVLLDANPLRAAVYVIVSIMVGVVWLAFGGARR